MSVNFTSYTDSILEQTDTRPLEPETAVDIFEFLTSPHYLCEDPTPFQRVATKTTYGLWGRYPPDEEESKVIRTLEYKWKIPFSYLNIPNPEIIVFVLGRRGTKSTLMSYFATYGIYTLICRGDPQRYYGIRERHPIYITHVAAAGHQAAAVFTLTSNNIKKMPFFRPYIDFDKDNTTELRLFSPHDIVINQRIKARNLLLSKGVMKENTQPGSLNIKSITTSASTNRGDATYMLMFSEFAHFMRAKNAGTQSGDQVMEENPQSDYAIAKALMPSVKDFGLDGKVIVESSPLEKGGEFYTQYCIAGGMEQDHPTEPEEGYVVIQLATWEARPSMPRETFDRDFRKDPRAANMEYGGHFGNPSGQFISEATINAIPIPERPLIRKNPSVWKFVISVDAGGKAKNKKDDTYAIGWGHSEGDINRGEDLITYWIDGFEGWNAEIKDLGGGQFEQIPVDPNKVVSFIVELVKDLGGRNWVQEIVYDQWQNQAAISALQHLGLPAIETTYTNPYKSQMYGNFLEKATLGQVKMFGIDDRGWIDRWKLEMKYLQQIISGKFVYYHHPASGPIQTDDFADVSANLVHRLILRNVPTKESIQDNRRQGVSGPIQVRQTVHPVIGPSLHRGSIKFNPRGGGFRNR